MTSCFMFAPINFKLSSPSNILTFSQVWLSAGQPRHSAPSLSPGPSETWSQPFLLIWRNARIQQRWLPWDKKRNVNTIKNIILMKYNFKNLTVWVYDISSMFCLPFSGVVESNFIIKNCFKRNCKILHTFWLYLLIECFQLLTTTRTLSTNNQN